MHSRSNTPPSELPISKVLKSTYANDDVADIGSLHRLELVHLFTSSLPLFPSGPMTFVSLSGVLGGIT